MALKYVLNLHSLENKGGEIQWDYSEKFKKTSYNRRGLLWFWGGKEWKNPFRSKQGQKV